LPPAKTGNVAGFFVRHPGIIARSPRLIVDAMMPSTVRIDRVVGGGAAAAARD
jgi:hypothetical protein